MKLSMTTSGRLVNTQIDNECIEDAIQSLPLQTDEVKAMYGSHQKKTQSTMSGKPATDSDHLGILHFNDHALNLLKHDLIQRKKRKAEMNIITSRDSDLTEDTSGHTPVDEHPSKGNDSKYRPNIDSGERPDTHSRSYSHEMLQLFLDQSGSEELLLAQDIREIQKATDNEIANIQNLQPVGPNRKVKKNNKVEKGLLEKRNRRSDLFTDERAYVNDEGDDGDFWKVDNNLKIINMQTYKNNRLESMRSINKDEHSKIMSENPLERGFLGKSMTGSSTGTRKCQSSTELPITKSQGGNHKSSSRSKAIVPRLTSPSQTCGGQHDHSRYVSHASTLKSDKIRLTGLFSRSPVTYGSGWTDHDGKVTEEHHDVESSFPSAAVLQVNKAMVSRQRKLKRNVTFSAVFIRDYERVLGNNPSCTSGPSLDLGWRYQRERKFSLDTFERCKGQLRQGSQLVLSRESREMILLDLGYSKKDLATAVRSNIKSKNQRRQTVTNLSVSTMEESLENAGRRVCSLFLGGGRKKEN